MKDCTVWPLVIMGTVALATGQITLVATPFVGFPQYGVVPGPAEISAYPEAALGPRFVQEPDALLTVTPPTVEPNWSRENEACAADVIGESLQINPAFVSAGTVIVILVLPMAFVCHQTSAASN